MDPRHGPAARALRIPATVRPRTTNLLPVLALLTGVPLLACAQGGEDGAMGRSFGGDGGGRPHPDAGASVPPPEMRPPDVPGGGARDYVVRLLQVGSERPSGSGVAAGFDLDGHATVAASDPVGCGRTDFTAPTTFGGHGGVDSQVGALLEEAATLVTGFDADASIEDSVIRGGTLILVRILDAGDLANDGHVEVLLYVGKTDSGGAPRTESTTSDGEPHIVLSTGQAFVIDARSVVDGDPDQPLIAFRDASISEGRLETAPADFDIDLALPSGPLTLALGGARLAFDVSADELTWGMIGAHVTVDAFTTNVVALVGDPAVTETLVRPILQARADIDVTSSPGCEALSLTFVFEGTQAAITAVR